ncbi:DNA-binding protein [Hirsutella rhossiliensis]|uniref:DNA-binding protein n=1 Tax=Hirsutella rhossiliensis TaxID=111463 RepID=A0A9P8SJY1_9HYPO|nr:DNA-binding protein [Hirsutella rhossiliensis]KAH0965386.1 DNA-binding protein [Hirsutella rhossiliensis]
MGRLTEALLYLWNFRYLPLKYRWPLIKWRRRLLPTRTGLGLRNSLRHARSLRHPPEPNAHLFVLRLLWPFPTWYFAAVVPPPPRVIKADPDVVSRRVRDLMYLRSMPLWRARDTPQRAFYRLYEAVCAADGPMITYETEYFWRRSSPGWATVGIPDPECDDAEQYAVMAALAEELVESFMWRLQLGLRRNDTPIMNRYKDPPPMVPEVCPAWATKVPALENKLLLHPDENVYFDSPFHRRNVYTATGSFYTV